MAIALTHLQLELYKVQLHVTGIQKRRLQLQLFG